MWGIGDANPVGQARPLATRGRVWPVGQLKTAFPRAFDRPPRDSPRNQARWKRPCPHLGSIVSSGPVDLRVPADRSSAEVRSVTNPAEG